MYITCLKVFLYIQNYCFDQKTIQYLNKKYFYLVFVELLLKNSSYSFLSLNYTNKKKLKIANCKLNILLVKKYVTLVLYQLNAISLKVHSLQVKEFIKKIYQFMFNKFKAQEI